MTHLKRFLRRDVLVSVPLIGGLMTFFSSAFGQVTDDDDIPKSDTPQVGPPNNLSISLEALQAEIRELQTRLEETDSQVSRLSQFDSPVGSVVGYLGPIPSDEMARWEWERRTGWLVCDGRPLASKPEFKELMSVLGVEHLPDMRCRFLRGVDVPTDGKFADLDEEKNRPVGTPQGYSTARPTLREGVDARFLTNEIPEVDLTSTRRSPVLGDNAHCNMLLSEVSGKGTVETTDTTAGEPNLYDCSPIKNVPAHKHTIDSGGNIETRPSNVTVYWIIKASARGLFTIAAPSPDA